MKKSKGQGWFGESHRHSLASRGIKSGQKQYSSLQKVPWKDAKKIQSIELKDDNTIVEKTISDEINEEKIPEEEKPEEEPIIKMVIMNNFFRLRSEMGISS
jgi:hypothetical protein